MHVRISHWSAQCCSRLQYNGNTWLYKKLSCCCDSRSYCVRRTTYGILANYQTWFRLQVNEQLV